MTDTVETPPPGERIEPRLIEQEMSESYLNYALSVIHSRALPDVRDGLKPSQRRSLVAMDDLKKKTSSRDERKWLVSWENGSIRSRLHR